MKFSLSPLVLVVVLFTSSFAAPTDHALSKRLLDFSFTLFNIANTGISLRDVGSSAAGYHLNKRLLNFSFTLFNIANTGISLKRDVHEFDEELSKRSEEYNLVVTSLTPGSGLASRSTDAYDGHHVVVYLTDAMTQGLQQLGLTQDDMPEYLSQAVHVTDPDTGFVYQLVPDSATGTSSADDIVLNLDFNPGSQ